MPNIFISYRRTDTTTGYASWIYDSLVRSFGADNVFMDVDSLPLGVDFLEQLERYAGKADVALILIGPGWLNATDKSGTRRLDDPNDIVRLEVAAVLRAHVRVIPVLVDGAAMPEAAALPNELRALARRHALVFDRRGGTGFHDLITTLHEVDRRPGPQPAQRQGSVSTHQEPRVVTPASPVSPNGRPRRRLALMAAGIVAMLIAAGIAVLLTTRSGPSSSNSATHTSSSHSNSILTALRDANYSAPIMGGPSAHGLIPPSHCKPHGASMVICSNLPSSVNNVTFTTYTSLPDLYSDYVAKARSLGYSPFRQNSGDCLAQSTVGEAGWNHNFHHPKGYTVKQSESPHLSENALAGRVACTFGSQEYHIIWTQNAGYLLGVVSGLTHENTWRWWYRVHHNIALEGSGETMGSGQKMDMSGSGSNMKASGSKSR